MRNLLKSKLSRIKGKFVWLLNRISTRRRRWWPHLLLEKCRIKYRYFGKIIRRYLTLGLINVYVDYLLLALHCKPLKIHSNELWKKCATSTLKNLRMGCNLWWRHQLKWLCSFNQENLLKLLSWSLPECVTNKLSNTL